MAGRNNRKRAPHDAEKRAATGKPANKFDIDNLDHADFDHPDEFRSDDVANTNAKGATTKRIVGTVLMVSSIVYWLGREFIKTIAFERVVKLWESNPPIELMTLIEYVPPSIFALLAIYFLAAPPNLLANISRRPPAVRAQSQNVIEPATAQVPPPAQYTKAQIGQMLDAIAEFYSSLLQMEVVLGEMIGTVMSLESDLASRGSSYLLAEFDRFRLKLLDPLNELNEAVIAFGLYTEVCKIVGDRRDRQEEFFNAYDGLIAILRESPEAMSLQAASIFVKTEKRALHNRGSKYLTWIGRAKSELSKSREHYLRWKTID